MDQALDVLQAVGLPGNRVAAVLGDVRARGHAAGGLLDAWVDFNRDGAWSPAEKFFSSLSLVPGVNSNLCFSVPWGAKLGPTYARFRQHMNQAGIPFNNAPQNYGEVEDYRVTIERAEPAMVRTAASMSAAVRSGILALAISSA